MGLVVDMWLLLLELLLGSVSCSLCFSYPLDRSVAWLLIRFVAFFAEVLRKVGPFQPGRRMVFATLRFLVEMCRTLIAKV